jgi:hypothetical protein
VPQELRPGPGSAPVSNYAGVDIGLPGALFSLFQAAVERGQEEADLPAAYVAMKAVLTGCPRPVEAGRAPGNSLTNRPSDTEIGRVLDNMCGNTTRIEA